MDESLHQQQPALSQELISLNKTASSQPLASSCPGPQHRWLPIADDRLQRGSTVYRNFSRSIDAKILGRKTFDLSAKMGAGFSADNIHYVFSRRPPPASVPAGDGVVQLHYDVQQPRV